MYLSQLNKSIKSQGGILKQVKIGLPENLYDLVEKWAKTMSMSKNEFVRHCVRVYISALENRKNKKGWYKD